MDNKPQCRLPKGLVGTKSIALINIKDKEISCLLDTGSKVTTIPRSFYDQHLSDQKIKPLHDILEVEGAAGQSVPYLGYVELVVRFPKEFIGIPTDVTTLALVVSNLSTVIEPLVLIGTNTLDVLFDVCSKTGISHQPIPSGYQAVLKVLEVRHRRETGPEPHAIVRLENNSQVILVRQVVILEGFATASWFLNEKSARLEHPDSSSLPGGLVVKPTLVQLTPRRPYKVPVRIYNESDHDVVIPPKCIIAQMNTYQTICSKQLSAAGSAEPSQEPLETKTLPKSTLNFNFDGSPISSEWKDHMTKQLDSMAAQTVKHHIGLSR
nr:uncharacterized protein LOC129160869 [Nothobranchius furzeri]